MDIFDEIGKTIAGIFDNPVVKTGIQAIAIYFVILWLAAAYWAFRDMQLRTENPILPYLAAAFIIVFTPIFFPLAVFVYRIIRPQEKIGEVYERNLAEEALLAEVEAIRSCPTCARRINDEWIICPTCRTRLNRVCPNCSRLVGLDWSLCAWCGKDFERREAAVHALPVAEDATRIASPATERSSGRAAIARAVGQQSPRGTRASQESSGEWRRGAPPSTSES
jgi:RNA polymerase subunit RPABC4/transcription elongation factor Spt4